MNLFVCCLTVGLVLIQHKQTGNKVFQGLKALKYLLKDSEQLEGEMKFMGDAVNEFRKSGGNAHANRDFWAIKPKHIRKSGPSGSSIIFGKVGDRVVILNEKGISDMPMIEIIRDSGGSLTPDVDVVYYQ